MWLPPLVIRRSEAVDVIMGRVYHGFGLPQRPQDEVQVPDPGGTSLRQVRLPGHHQNGLRHIRSQAQSQRKVGKFLYRTKPSRNKTFLKLKLKIFPTGMLFRSPQLSSAPACGLGLPPTGPYPMSPGPTRTLWQKSRQRGSTFSAKNVSHSR